MHRNIQWPRAQYWDKPWNPTIGCVPISPACEHCYANSIAQRFGVNFKPHATCKINPPRKGVVFCGNMTDLFGEWIPTSQASQFILKTIGNNRDATYLWLTKRPAAMSRGISCAYLDYTVQSAYENIPQDVFNITFNNQYFGFTAEDQKWYDLRFGVFRMDKSSWANGWLSAEPLLGPIDLHLGYIAPEDLPFKWIVVGCESGPKRRPCDIEWVRSIVRQARERSIPVFVKQLDIDGRCERDIDKFPADLRIREVPWNTNGKEDK